MPAHALRRSCSVLGSNGAGRPTKSEEKISFCIFSDQSSGAGLLVSLLFLEIILVCRRSNQMFGLKVLGRILPKSLTWP